MLGSGRYTSKQKVYDWSSNKSDLRSHHDRLASSWPAHAIHQRNLGPEIHNHSPTAMIHLWPTSDWPVMLYDELTTDPRPGHDRLEWPVWLGKILHEINISRVTCDRFTILPNDIQGHQIIYDQHAKTWDQRRIQQQVGSLASEIDNFHDHFWQLKVVMGFVDFNGE